MDNIYILKKSRSIADLTGVGDMVPGTRTITRINVPSEHRSKGLGSKLLGRICADADREAVSLSLEILPSGPLSYEDLQRWYVRYGFRRSGKFHGILIRRPRQCRPSTYGIIVGEGVEFGFRCPTHGVSASQRFHTERELFNGILVHWRETVRPS